MRCAALCSRVPAVYCCYELPIVCWLCCAASACQSTQAASVLGVSSMPLNSQKLLVF